MQARGNAPASHKLARPHPRVGPKASAVPHRGFSFRARAPGAPTRVAAARDKRAAPAPSLIYTAPRPASRPPQRGRGQPTRGRGQSARGLGAHSISRLPGAPPFSARAPIPLRSRVGGGGHQLPVVSFLDASPFPSTQEPAARPVGRAWGAAGKDLGVLLSVYVMKGCACAGEHALSAAALLAGDTLPASPQVSLRLPLQSLLSLFLCLVLLKTSCFRHCLRAR